MHGLFTTAPPSVKFKKIGDSVEGEIIDVYQTQRYEYIRGAQGEPLYWHGRKPEPVPTDPATGKKNEPVLQYVLVLETGIEDENGNTERRLFVKNKRMEQALKKAILLARAKEGLLIGGRVRCTYTADDETSDAPSLPKIYEYAYTKPEPGRGQLPSGEVRLAERDDEDEPVPAAVFAAAEPRVVPQPASAAARESLDRLVKAHESSPLMRKAGVVPAAPVVGADEPPF